MIISAKSESRVYHMPGCRYAEMIKEENVMYKKVKWAIKRKYVSKDKKKKENKVLSKEEKQKLKLKQRKKALKEKKQKQKDTQRKIKVYK